MQSANTLGKMDVALFDEDMEIVMDICWGDAWYELVQRSFFLTYYPEGGDSSGASTPYITESFMRTGRMWYEDGNIKYEIEQPGRVQTGDLGPAGNPYRLIKYVVVRPSRSGSFSLVDMRIRQISVTSGCRVPTEKSADYPSPVRTTNDELTKDENFATLADVNDGVNEAGTYYYCNWLCSFWPTLCIHILNQIRIALLEFTIDLLGAINWCDQILVNWMFDFLGLIIPYIPLISNVAKIIVAPEIMWLWWIALFAWHGSDTLRNSGVGIVASVAAILGATALSLAFFAAWHSYVIFWLEAGLGYIGAAGLYCVMLINLISIIFLKRGVIAESFACVGILSAIYFADLWCPGFLSGVDEWNPVFGAGTVIFKIVSIVFMLYWTIYYTIKYSQTLA